MVTLSFRFPAGRYHATPPGHHVNEGLIEWPPSPWRLLRALIACGYATQRWDTVPGVAASLILKLAGTLPRYRLPPATLAHSRHYMPVARDKTTLVFDTWANVGNGALSVHWPCALDAEESALLGLLASSLGYLGRSESWVEARLMKDGEPLSEGSDAYPHGDGIGAERGWEQVLLMAPEEPETYRAWRAERLAPLMQSLPEENPKKGKSKRVAVQQKLEEPYPINIIDCLQRDTAWWKEHRWSQPPGSRRVLYWRRAELEIAPPLVRARVEPAAVTMMLLALSAPNRSPSMLPLRARTLPQAELVHRALVGRIARGERIDCPELIGKDSLGQPLIGHKHAHIVPLDLDQDGHLDHIVVYAPMGLRAGAQRAVRGMKRTWTKGSANDLQVSVVGAGSLESLRSLPAPFARGVDALLGPAEGARVWMSATAFVPPRHLKKTGANALEGQVRAELSSRGLPSAQVETLPMDDVTRALRHMVRVRRAPAAPPPIDMAIPLRLIFDEPVRGPISLGYASHFGLGRFSAHI